MIVTFLKDYAHKSKSFKKGTQKNIDAGLAKDLEKREIVSIENGETMVEKGISEEEYERPVIKETTPKTKRKPRKPKK